MNYETAFTKSEKVNHIQCNKKYMYLFLLVELRKVFAVLWALLYEQEYMDTAKKKCATKMSNTKARAGGINNDNTSD